jgi:hypothetical protein
MPIETESTKDLIELLTSKEGGGSKETAKLKELAELLLSRPSLTNEELVNRLKRAFEHFQTKHSFSPGQLVRWKAGMRDKKLPREGEPAIVIEVLPSPMLDPTTETGAPYFRQPLDIVVGVVGREGELLTFHFDSRRFEPWDTEQSATHAV